MGKLWSRVKSRGEEEQQIVRNVSSGSQRKTKKEKQDAVRNVSSGSQRKTKKKKQDPVRNVSSGSQRKTKKEKQDPVQHVSPTSPKRREDEKQDAVQHHGSPTSPKGREDEKQKTIQNVSSGSRTKKKKSKQEQVLTAQPWRNTERWSKEVREEFKNDIARRFPETYEQLHVPCYNIALTGEIGAGKSSYFNSLNNIFREEVTGARADVGEMATSLTTEYRVYKIKRKGTFEHLPWRICDTMGLQSNKPNDSSNILKAINGHVPDRFKFTDEEINQDTPGYIADPELKDKAHCIAIVVNATKLELMNEEVKEKLKTLRKELGAPRTYILLTHIDEVCMEVKQDVTNVYHSIAIRDLVRKVGSILDGLPENQIFPIMNYSKQVQMEDAMDILLLYPLRQMLSNAQNYLNDELDQQPRQSSHTPLTQRGQLVMQPAD